MDLWTLWRWVPIVGTFPNTSHDSGLNFSNSLYSSYCTCSPFLQRLCFHRQCKDYVATSNRVHSLHNILLGTKSQAWATAFVRKLWMCVRYCSSLHTLIRHGLSGSNPFPDTLFFQITDGRVYGVTCRPKVCRFNKSEVIHAPHFGTCMASGSVILPPITILILWPRSGRSTTRSLLFPILPTTIPSQPAFFQRQYPHDRSLSHL